MGKQISILVALLFFVTVQVQAQKNLSFKEVDSTTYDLYLKQDWKSLIEVGKQSRQENINFYYLNVRMGIAYYNDNKMLSSVKELEEAYLANSFDIVVQEYLYWAYRFSGMVLESHLFFEKMSKPMKDKINLDLPFISSIDIGFLGTSNVDFDTMSVSDINADNNDVRIFPESYSYYSIALNHPLSKKVNFYHQLTFISIKNNQQENTSNLITNKLYNSKESRYYADVTFALENRWYLDAYLTIVSGNFENVNVEKFLNFGGPKNVSNSSTIKYADIVFGASFSKASYFSRSSVNASISNLNNKKQFQAGYSVSLFPLGSTVFVPFGSIQYQNENTVSNIIYSGGLAISTNKFSVTGFGTFGDITNYVSNNGGFIYNQVAKTTSEVGLILKVFTKNSVIKAGYTFAEMEDFYQTQDNEILTKTYNFNQQNLIVGITWNF